MTNQEHSTAKQMLSAYELAANKWMKENKTNGIPAEVCASFPYSDVVNNELRSAVEVYEFINYPPEKYFLYISESKKIATTWTGQELGFVKFGREYRATFGDVRQSVRITACNGLVYSGTYYKSAGNYARVKALKHA